MGCISKLNQVIYSDSEVLQKVTCARTKTEATVNNVRAAHSVAMALLYLNEISSLGVFTDSSDHGSLTLFPAVI
jgi:hypothetical protein